MLLFSRSLKKLYRGGVYVHIDVKGASTPRETKIFNTWAVKVIGTLMKCNKNHVNRKKSKVYTSL